jgi:hypothetical protein
LNRVVHLFVGRVVLDRDVLSDLPIPLDGIVHPVTILLHRKINKLNSLELLSRLVNLHCIHLHRVVNSCPQPTLSRLVYFFEVVKTGEVGALVLETLGR